VPQQPCSSALYPHRLSAVLEPAQPWDVSSLPTSEQLRHLNWTHHRILTTSRADFLAGQFFDIRLEVHQPVNGSEAIGLPLDEAFTFTIAKGDGVAKPAVEYFTTEEPKLEKWNFTWFEGEYS
jgi:hypothetical protein